MSLQRILSILLLFSYGIPAGLGPFWHQHQHHHDHGSTPGPSSGHKCCSSDIDAAILCARADVECPDQGEHVCGCTAGRGNSSQVTGQVVATTAGHSGGESTAVNDSSDQPFSLPSLSANMRCQGNCAICAFYAQSQTSSMGSVGISSGTLVEWSVASRLSAEGQWRVGFSARGPPSSVLC